jgi:ribosome-associated protein
LVELIRQALIAPKRRLATKPTYGSIQRRITAKKVRSGIKLGRQTPEDED